MPAKTLRTPEDLARVVRALAGAFQAEEVFIIGSQAILASMPDAPEAARESPEVDAFPGNARVWEIAQQEIEPGVNHIASEYIFKNFGEGSQFHDTHGFFIDGVDETTATFPRGWKSRAVRAKIEVDGRMVEGVAPSPVDLVVSKLARLDPKDRWFVEAIHKAKPLDLKLVQQRIQQTNLDPAVAQRAIDYVRSLAAKSENKPAAPKPPWSSASDEDGQSTSPSSSANR
jgi:hypothetical protein